MTKELIFVDTETTGLDSKNDTLVELSWARTSGTVRTLYFGVVEVPSFIDDFINFTARGISGKTSQPREFEEFYRASEGNTMVAANPPFDKSFLDANDLFRFHYRTLDIETYAMAKLDLPEVPSMKEIVDILGERGFRVNQPRHTSRSDVEAMRDSYLVMRNRL